MDTSILIARLMGPLLVVAGLVGLVDPKNMREIAREFMASRALIFIAGVLALVAGLAIVNAHNHWVADWPVVVTVFGWLAVVGGITRMAFPDLARSMGEAMLSKVTLLRGISALQAVLGLYLTAMGYL